MLEELGDFDQAFAHAPEPGSPAPSLGPLRRRKTLRERFAFWGLNLLIMPLVALCYLTIGAEGLRRTMGVFSMRLYKLPVPGAGLLRQYDGWDRLDLSMLMALVLFGGVTFIWMRLFRELLGFGAVRQVGSRRPILLGLLGVVAIIVVLGDAAIFYVGLQSQVASGWGDAPEYVPLVATVVYMAGLALVGAFHADYHYSGIV